jgi:uncharacterized protein (TIGR00375 family)
MVVADLQLHSRYARACSKLITPAYLSEWAARKGVNVMTTGDITHPLWRREMQKAVVEREAGLFVLKEDADTPHAPRFVLGGEVSLMFRQGEIKGRRVHVLFVAPSFAAVESLVAQITHKGKLASDGRPILSMSCRDFALACKAADPDIIIIPAHIWTPWFGLLGSKSGFDSIEDAFEDTASMIHTYETGLSADPQMCWRVGSLQNRVLVSASDAHSGPNLMREALLLNGTVADYSYERLAAALTQLGNPDYFGTLEFFPEEGKYHADGHAACNVVLEPEQTRKLNGLCPICGKALTVGVGHRAMELASESVDFKPKGAGQVVYSVPLQEIIAEALSKKKTAKAAQDMYMKMTDAIAPEYAILHELHEFPEWVPPRIIEGIKKVRSGDVMLKPGYDGVYGIVKLFDLVDPKVTLWEAA